MGLDDIFDLAGDLDPRRAIELADDLWDDRDKIGEVIALVWENKDRLTAALDWIRDHGDDLIDLADRLPKLLSTAGDALDAAGGGAVRAAGFLGDGDGAVRALTDVAAVALERCREELGGVQNMISGLGAQLDKVEIPTLKTKTSEIAGFTVISGIDIGTVGLVDKAADQLDSGAGKIARVADDLATVAEQLRRLGVSVADAGDDLAVVGDRLTSSGGALKELGGGAPTPTKKAAPKKKPAKKAAKKAAARKRSAKKPAARKKPAKKAAAKRSART